MKRKVRIPDLSKVSVLIPRCRQAAAIPKADKRRRAWEHRQVLAALRDGATREEGPVVADYFAGRLNLRGRRAEQAEQWEWIGKEVRAIQNKDGCTRAEAVQRFIDAHSGIRLARGDGRVIVRRTAEDDPDNEIFSYIFNRLSRGQSRRDKPRGK